MSTPSTATTSQPFLLLSLKVLCAPIVFVWRTAYPPIPAPAPVTADTIIQHDLREARIARLNHAKLAEFHQGHVALLDNRIIRLTAEANTTGN